MTRTATAVKTNVPVDLIDVITATADPTVSTTTWINVIITTNTAVMTDAMITIATIVTKTTAMTSMTTDVTTAVTTNAMIAAMTSVMIDIARVTTTTTTTTAWSALHHHHLKGATPMVRFKQRTERSTSSSTVAKRPKATGSFDQTQGRLGTSTLKPRKPCIGRSSCRI
jgi:hypothetical protein